MNTHKESRKDKKEIGKFLIIEQGEYSDYSMYFIKVPENSKISEANMAFLIGLDSWDTPTITGHVWGEIDIRVENLKERAEKEINALFSCYDNRKYKTVLDKKYSKDELLDIVTANDGSGMDYWKNRIDEKYEKYVKAFGLYKLLK
jgi:hypothetical protein